MRRLSPACLVLLMQCHGLAVVSAHGAPAPSGADSRTELASREGPAPEGGQGAAATGDASAIARRQDAERPPGIDDPLPRLPESRVSFRKMVSPGGEKPKRAPGYRLEFLALGVEVGYGAGLIMEVGRLFWRHLMVVPLRLQGSLHYSPVLVPALRVGSLVGFGGSHGRGGRFSHWFLTGSELFFAEGNIGLWSVGTTQLIGWLVPLGYEFRYRFTVRRHVPRSLGVRLTVAFMPIYQVRYWDGSCPDGNWFCNAEAPRITWPLAWGISIIYGYG